MEGQLTGIRGDLSVMAVQTLLFNKRSRSIHTTCPLYVLDGLFVCRILIAVAQRCSSLQQVGVSAVYALNLAISKLCCKRYLRLGPPW